MRTIKLKYYRWQKKRARAGMRKVQQKTDQAGKVTPELSAERTKYEKRHEAYAKKWYALVSPTLTAGADITGIPVSLNDIRVAVGEGGDLQSPDEFITATDDKHVEVTFVPTDEGLMRQLNDGEKAKEYDFPAEVLSSNPKPVT